MAKIKKNKSTEELIPRSNCSLTEEKGLFILKKRAMLEIYIRIYTKKETTYARPVKDTN